MKGETLPKPPPLLLPPIKLKPSLYSEHYALKGKDKSNQEKSFNKFTAKYDTFHGILKRVADMKMNGSLDSEEPSTESEKSEGSTSNRLKNRVRSGSSSIDEPSNVSFFEDESSVSSITESDHCLPYEEVPRLNNHRYSCISLPSPTKSTKDDNGSLPSPPPVYVEGTFSSFRDSFPPPPSPSELYFKDFSPSGSRKNSCVEYKTKTVNTKGRNSLMRPTSLYCDREKNFSPDVNDNCTNNLGKRVPVDESSDCEGISEQEKHQLEMFFKSLKTEVFICDSLVNLYVAWKEQEGNWTFKHTGVLVVILDCGDTRSRRKRKIQILLAERGTCFPLWKDTIDNLSSYKKSGTGFHTMYLSSDHRQMLGFSFDSPDAADKLLQHIEALTSNPENINISVPGSRKKSKGSSHKKPAPLPHKKQISNPCLFQHVTSVMARDKPIYMSLQTLINPDAIKKDENIH